MNPMYEPNPELLKELEQLKQSVTGLQTLLDAANYERTRLEHELALAKQSFSARFSAQICEKYFTRFY